MTTSEWKILMIPHNSCIISSNLLFGWIQNTEIIYIAMQYYDWEIIIVKRYPSLCEGEKGEEQLSLFLTFKKRIQPPNSPRSVIKENKTGQNEKKKTLSHL